MSKALGTLSALQRLRGAQIEPYNLLVIPSSYFLYTGIGQKNDNKGERLQSSAAHVAAFVTKNWTENIFQAFASVTTVQRSYSGCLPYLLSRMKIHAFALYQLSSLLAAGTIWVSLSKMHYYRSRLLCFPITCWSISRKRR